MLSKMSKGSFDIRHEIFKVSRSRSHKFVEEVRSKSLAKTAGANHVHQRVLLSNALKEKRFDQVPNLRHGLERGPSDCHT